MKVPPEAKNNVGLKNVFVCSMADLFGRWVPEEWIQRVLDATKEGPDWNFLYLTKNPNRYMEFDFPKNSWLGTTVDRQGRVKKAVETFEQFDAAVKFLSCEPLFEKLTFPSLEMFDWVIIGGASASSQTEAYTPKSEHVEYLVNQARDAGCMVYFKPNLGYEPKEYPIK
jgi:protein gp37